MMKKYETMYTPPVVEVRKFMFKYIQISLLRNTKIRKKKSRFVIPATNGSL